MKEHGQMPPVIVCIDLILARVLDLKVKVSYLRMENLKKIVSA